MEMILLTVTDTVLMFVVMSCIPGCGVTNNVSVYIDGIMMNVQRFSDECVMLDYASTLPVTI